MGARLEKTQDGNFISPDDPGESGYDRVSKRRSVTEQEAGILRELCRGKRVLEIGTGLGVSTVAMAETAASVTSVDVDPWCHFAREFPENVTLLSEMPIGGEFDITFIDGNHRYDSVMRDIRQATSRVLVIHDSYLKDVRRAIKDSKLLVVEVYPTRCRLALCEKP